MAANFNKVILIGNLTRDVELRHLPSGQAIAKIGIATNRRWRTPEGEQREETMFIDCEAWGKQAEFVSQYFNKGKSILIEGRLKLDQWEDKETKAKRSKHVVVVENVSFVDSKPGSAAGGDEAPTPRVTTRPAAGSAPAAAAPTMGEEDIPF